MSDIAASPTESRQQRRAAARAAANRTRKRLNFDGPTPLLMTIERAAHELSCSPRTIYNMVARNDLELVHVGPRCARISSESIRRIAARQRIRQPVKIKKA